MGELSTLVVVAGIEAVDFDSIEAVLSLVRSGLDVDFASVCIEAESVDPVERSGLVDAVVLGYTHDKISFVDVHRVL